MTRELFEKLALDMEMDVSRSATWDRYLHRETERAWRIWTGALEAKEAVADPEPPVQVSLEDIHTASLYFGWGQAKCGFGELSIGLRENGTVSCMNETMSRRWVRKALHAAIDTLVDAAKLEE